MYIESKHSTPQTGIDDQDSRNGYKPSALRPARRRRYGRKRKASLSLLVRRPLVIAGIATLGLSIFALSPANDTHFTVATSGQVTEADTMVDGAGLGN